MRIEIPKLSPYQIDACIELLDVFEEVINPLITAGFKILKIEDLKPIDALRTLDPFSFGKFSKLASFMCVIVEKE